MHKHILQTGLTDCYDSDGVAVPCCDSGQDGEFTPGLDWPEPRFTPINDHLVCDQATRLIWPMNAGLLFYQMTWKEGLEAIVSLNDEKKFDRSDWRMPNRREMRSLISHGAKKPALPDHHPFTNVFLGWYWTSTTSAVGNRYAWYVHLEGGRMFYGHKESYYLVWPVCGKSDILPSTGQVGCFGDHGKKVNCMESGQDGALSQGVAWPMPRFENLEYGVFDRLTSLTWYPHADLLARVATWEEALAGVKDFAEKTGRAWRLPTINELESLVDASRFSPALPEKHPFHSVEEAYWSSTTSYFEPDWAYVLYLNKGAVGVGYKRNRDFFLWPVLDQ